MIRVLFSLFITVLLVFPVAQAEEPESSPAVESLVAILDGLRANPEAAEAAKSAVESRLESVRAERRAHEERIESLSRSVAELEAQIAAQQKELEELREKLAQEKQKDPGETALYKETLRVLETITGSDEGEPVEEESTPDESSDTPAKEAAAEANTVEATQAALPEGGVQFNQDIRPILSNNCFACHGPDENTRKAGLRLDDGEDLFAEQGSGATPIVPDDRGASELYARITSDDPNYKMPPPEFDKELSGDQIERLGQWIDEGAEWQRHWAYIPPQRPAAPTVANQEWVRNTIDRFVLAKLEREGIAPSAEVDRRTLIRRVTLDLTGLPPTLDEIEGFLADDSPDAYEKVVDRLLASLQYGEHMARYWLDAARYADTNGYHIDNERYMWPWRDWVIEAFNENMPFDQFTIEQLAGDLLPNPTQSQLIASGFNRNHMINFEGGAIPEEYRTQYVVDRVDTTTTVWMGLTAACAQCHDHKYDPLSQREFFELFAFFNTVDEKGLDGREGNAKPFMKAPSAQQKARLAEFREEMDSVKAELAKPDPELEQALAAWAESKQDELPGPWTMLQPREATSANGATLEAREDGAIVVTGENPDTDIYEVVAYTGKVGVTAIKLDVLPHEEREQDGPGRAENGNFVLTELEAEVASAEKPDETRPVRFALASADYAQPDYPAMAAIDGDGSTGYGANGQEYPGARRLVFVPTEPFGYPVGTKVVIRLKQESEFKGHGIGRFRLSVTTDDRLRPAEFSTWYISGPYAAKDGAEAYETAYAPEQQEFDVSAVSEDGRYLWTETTGLNDGQVHPLPGEIAATYLYRKIEASTARPLALRVGSNDAVKIWLNGDVVHDNNVQRAIGDSTDTVQLSLAEGENELLMKVVNYGNAYAFSFERGSEQLGTMPLEYALILARSPDERIKPQNDALRTYYRRQNDPEFVKLEQKLASLNKEYNELYNAVPTVMVMGEMEEPRETHLLERGQYDAPGEVVFASTPEFLPALETEKRPDRLDLARWLVSGDHPLTARVTVNRFWQRFFGTGIVKSSEDFGAQGEWPTHPRLLDWLATEFVASGWDIKHMHRLMVMSATYRQASHVRPDLTDRDPQNRLLARGPRYRLDAETLRDNALAVSGLLVDKVGGPSVRPYQPAGLWKEVSYGAGYSAQIFEKDEGEGLYRRSMYTFWKRQAPPPQMVLFDAPNRETCVVRRERTNTPLQALMLMNSTQYVEAARALAERVLHEADEGVEARIVYGFELATSRKPDSDEVAVLESIYEEQLQEFKKQGDAAAAFLSVGDRPPDESFAPEQLGAWTTVMSTILNLDETISKT